MGGRGALWRWGWGIGFALLCVYIAFDVLDLDGSQLQGRSEAAITAETCSAQADRLKAMPLLPSEGLLPVVLTDPWGARLRPAAVSPSAARTMRLLLRRHLSRLDARIAPRSADPA